MGSKQFHYLSHPWMDLDIFILFLMTFSSFLCNIPNDLLMIYILFRFIIVYPIYLLFIDYYYSSVGTVTVVKL